MTSRPQWRQTLAAAWIVSTQCAQRFVDWPGVAPIASAAACDQDERRDYEKHRADADAEQRLELVKSQGLE